MTGCNCGSNCECNSAKKNFDNEALIFKALAHPSRLLMLNALRKGRLCVCELQQLVGSDISTVSKHLKILKDCKILAIEKEKNFIYYHVSMPCVLEFMDCISTDSSCSCSES